MQFLATFLALYVIIAARYFAICGAFYWYLWLRPEHKVRARKLTDQRPEAKVIRREIYWSLLSSAIYALPGAIMLEAWKHGYTAMYQELSAIDLVYLPLSVLLFLFLHDTYFYWTHRWMHRPRIFKLMHKVHHDSRQPTPWAAFSFHPWEALLGAVVLPALVFVIPIHVGAILFILTLMTVCSVLNHTGFEVLPNWWLRGAPGRHCISAAHHNLHHQRYSCNYGLYFRFWDKLMGTDRFEQDYAFLRESPLPPTRLHHPT
ncbi:MAG: sterol desaturase family protein [Gammaproteobacteria bacterium]|nr:sterol desaturase family protein [Gammaproteobacteria bacterium]